MRPNNSESAQQLQQGLTLQGLASIYPLPNKYILSDRQNYESWLEGGANDTAQRAYHLWKELLARYEPPPLDPAIREVLEDYVARRERELENQEL